MAEPGKTTAIIGSTGCGKSTLVNLIPRLYDVTGGTVTLDGTDIRELALHELREEIGFVPQKGVLFSGTIASNLRFGRAEASDEELKEAARIAQASDFIEEKEEKYDSPIAQGGSNVSGGQKQRLAIARAIAKNPQIYIFDDSFSALDLKTDAALRKALAEKVSDKTVLIVPRQNQYDPSCGSDPGVKRRKDCRKGDARGAAWLLRDVSGDRKIAVVRKGIGTGGK